MSDLWIDLLMTGDSRTFYRLGAIGIVHHRITPAAVKACAGQTADRMRHAREHYCAVLLLTHHCRHRDHRRADHQQEEWRLFAERPLQIRMTALFMVFPGDFIDF